MALNPDRQSIAAMWSLPHRIPLSRPALQRLCNTIAALGFDRIYDGWRVLVDDGMP